jgi:hypothetical protein
MMGGAGADKHHSATSIVYFSVDGVRTESVEGNDAFGASRRAVAKLGADGWEMVAVNGDNPLFYFKRRLP